MMRKRSRKLSEGFTARYRKTCVGGRDGKDSEGPDGTDGDDSNQGNSQAQEKRNSFKMTDFSCITQPTLVYSSSSDSESSVSSSRYLLYFDQKSILMFF